MITHFLFCFVVASLRNKHHCIINFNPYVLVSFPSSFIIFPFQHLGWFFFAIFLVYKWDPETAHHSSFSPFPLRKQPPYANFTRFIVVLLLFPLLLCAPFFLQCVFTFAWVYNIQGITRLSPLTDGLSCMCCICAPFIFLSSLFSVIIFRSSLFPFFSFFLSLSFIPSIFRYLSHFSLIPSGTRFFTNCSFSQRFSDFFLVRLIFLRQIDAKEIGAASAATLIGCSPSVTSPQ